MVKSNSQHHPVSTGSPSNPHPDARYIDHWYAYFLRKYNSIDLTLGGALVIHTATYWGVGLSLLAFEKVLPSIALRYKTQPRKIVRWTEILKLLKRVVVNQLLLLVSFLAVSKLRPKFLIDDLDKKVNRTPPSYLRIAADYVFNLGVFEIVFYCFHRALHDLRWYKYIHKIHHEFKAPIALAAEYAHIVELILSNIVPGAIGPASTNAHPVSTWVWLFGSLVQTLFHHSGLMLPFYPLNQWTIDHDFHHASFQNQFGVVGMMDTALKTTGGEPYNQFSNDIWQRMTTVASVAGSAIVRSATAAIRRRSSSSRMPSQLFQTVVR